MTTETIAFDHRAEIALDVFSDKQRKELLRILEKVRRTPQERWSRLGVEQVDPENGLYMVSGPGDFRVFFKAADADRLVVQFIFRQETLDWLATQG